MDSRLNRKGEKREQDQVYRRRIKEKEEPNLISRSKFDLILIPIGINRHFRLAASLKINHGDESDSDQDRESQEEDT